jgi:hypothetical protein
MADTPLMNVKGNCSYVDDRRAAGYYQTRPDCGQRDGGSPTDRSLGQESFAWAALHIGPIPVSYSPIKCASLPHTARKGQAGAGLPFVRRRQCSSIIEFGGAYLSDGQREMPSHAVPLLVALGTRNRVERISRSQMKTALHQFQGLFPNSPAPASIARKTSRGTLHNSQSVY